MRKLALILFAGLMVACGATGAPDGRSVDGGTGGTAGTGGSGATGGTGGTVEPPPPQAVDETCRDWCANEAEGGSCHEGPFESVQPCYEGCLATYQVEAGRECGDQWIAIKRCQLDLECADLFGDCDSSENAHSECVIRAFDREYCASNCPTLDPNECDRATCQGHIYCEGDCPTMDRDQCIEQHISAGQCDDQEAVAQCRQYCTQQDLSQCVDQWRSTGRCEFDHGYAACNALCPDSGGWVCATYWEKYEECPSSSGSGACYPICLGDCVIEGVDPSQGLNQCVSTCQQQKLNEDHCTQEGIELYDCLQANTCASAQTATCGGQATALSDCLSGMCGVLCSGACVLSVPSVTGGGPATIDPGVGFDPCLSSCLQDFPSQNHTIGVAENLNQCLETNGCAAQTTTCADAADTVNLLLTVPFD